MNHTAIVTESAANLPPELVEQYGVHVLPLTINWGGESYRDGVDISPEAFYARMETAEQLPTTASVTIGDMLTTFTSLAGEVDDIVAIFISSNLTSSVEFGHLVKQMEPSLPLHIIDSRTAAMAPGFVVLEAARAAAAGATVDEVIERAKEMVDKVHLLAVLETLSYLRRGGRIGAAAALMGTLLHMKPVVSLPPGQGTLSGVARPRTWSRALDHIYGLMDEKVGDRPLHVAVSHCNRLAEAEIIAGELSRRFDVQELHITYLTPVMGAHTGPVVAICFYTNSEP